MATATRRTQPAERRRPDALGTVERLTSGRFRAYYRHAGEKFTAGQTFTTKQAAQGWLAQERADRLRGTWRDPRAGQTTLAEYATSYLESRTELAPRTRGLYDRLLERWILPRLESVELGTFTLGQLTPTLVRRWYAELGRCTRESALRHRHGQPARPPVGHPARLWGQVNGWQVAPTGRLSPALLRAWAAAGSPDGTTTAGGADYGQAGRTVAAQAYALLRTLCNAAVRDGLLVNSPCTLSGAATVRRAERQTAAPEQVAQLAANMPTRYAAAVTVAAWSGLRQGELFALRRGDVDLSAGCVHVRRGRDGLTKTAGSVRTVYLPGFVTATLAAHLARFTGSGPDALVFPSATGSMVASSNLSVIFARARGRVGGLDSLTWHDLRHTGATLAYTAGANIREVQRRLGHTTTRAAMLYAHAADDSDRLLADRLDATYRPAG